MGEIQYSQKILGLANLIRRSYNVSTGNNGAQVRILSFILENYEERNIFQKDIEEELNTRSASISTILKRLEEQQMIVRERVPYDDRLKRICPTRLATDMKEKMENGVQSVENQLVADISKEELETFREVAQKMTDNMTEKKARSKS